MKSEFFIPKPQLQIDFSALLAIAKKKYLHEALSETVGICKIAEIDQQLSKLVPTSYYQKIAKIGIRGELIFPVPCLLTANPYLICYYRLLLGYSQKLFYTNETGLSTFKSMEEKGVITPRNLEKLTQLCQALIESACYLIDGICVERVSKELLHELTVLTLGPQLRGGSNVKKGIAGNDFIFKAILRILKKNVVSHSQSSIVIKNAAKRKVYIGFSSDPDIVIKESLDKHNFRNIIAIEIKGGTDFSNIHNRIGEAEKSHQKARQDGFVECWTIVNVDRIDMGLAKRESPSTNRFYRISQITSGNGSEYEDFRNRIISLCGISSHRKR